ncbi:beta-agarase [Azotobacter salinestris]|uniref:beta-agarase n=1 Tax=Azotobacter salinestris TaxID=69964 RepID=UPI001266A5E2|nr:beta-agarase [Azotobacter salinestris]
MIRPLVPLLFACCLVPLSARAADEQVLFNFVRPTDVVQVKGEGAFLPQLTAESTAGGEVLRRVTFNPQEQPSLRLTPQQGSWDWSSAGAVSLRIQNAMDWALTLQVSIESADGKVLRTLVALPAGPAQTLVLPLRASSPRAHGMRAAPPMPWTHDNQRLLVATNLEGEIDPRQVRAVSLSLERPDVQQSILLGRFGVREDLEAAAYRGIVDAHGQYSRGNWPEKVSSDKQLKAAAEQERAQLGRWLAERPGLDRFGGWLKGPQLEATGFFRVARHEGRWYLVTPEGHPFFSLGVNTVSSGNSRTYVEGREEMFLALPGEDGPLGAFYGAADSRQATGANGGRQFAHGRWYDFYRANLYRTYGQTCKPPAEQVAEPERTTPAAPTEETPANAPVVPEAGVPVAGQPAAASPCVAQFFDAQRWREHTLGRLQAWGFNTLGNWSDLALGAMRRVPYTIPLLIRGDYATISTGHDWWGGMPDPFDPRFAMAAERAIAIATRDHRNDPWVIGYFADNELSWAAPGTDPKARYALAYGTLRQTTDVPAKRAFLKLLRDRYRNQQGLSAAWGIELPAWELMEDPGFEAPLPSPEHPAIEEDLQRFQQLFADTYFKTIAESLKWHSPDHLLLGGRFAISTPEAVAACARYCDVLSFNFYTREPQHGYDFEALRKLDKPVLVSEFHFGSRDRGPFWGGMAEVYKEEERGPAYAHFLERALAEPSIVGVHWFQYLDQPVTGRLLDGENGHIGLVGVTDRPFAGFVEAVRKANLEVGEALEPAAPAAGQAAAGGGAPSAAPAGAQ